MTALDDKPSSISTSWSIISAIGRDKKDWWPMAELTDEQIAAEEKFLKGIPRINIAAFLLPPIWGPAHGLWATILFYPIWLFADNAFYAAYTEQTTLSYIIALVIFVSLVAVSVVFSILSQPYAAHRADKKGISKDTYVKRQRIWALVSIVLGCAMLAGATYYNVVIRPTLGV